MDALATPHGELALPAFLPDATRGVVRAVDAADLEAVGVPGLVVCAYHLMQRPGAQAVAALGGLHALMGWRRPIVVDSGGFQVFSLIRQNPRLGSITDKQAVFRAAEGRKKQRLSPEKSIRTQFAVGADILVCLDDCTHPDDPPGEQAASVDRTVRWARRCRDEFDRVLAERGLGEAGRPLLFAVVQGGRDLDLRRRCAEALIEMGFEGYAFGGWPFDREGRLLREVLARTAELLPDEKPKYALGIGNPDALVACARMGYSLFDCSLPTRDARRGRLYLFPGPGLDYRRLYIRDARYHRDPEPVAEGCTCPCCRAASRAYLHHLFAIADPLALRLATAHNLRFYATLMERLRRGAPG
ncbi:MAG: tRNA-guanine transglycosylase [bacterium]